jgi:hypothetical protein
MSGLPVCVAICSIDCTIISGVDIKVDGRSRLSAVGWLDCQAAHRSRLAVEDGISHHCLKPQHEARMGTCMDCLVVSIVELAISACASQFICLMERFGMFSGTKNPGSRQMCQHPLRREYVHCACEAHRLEVTVIEVEGLSRLASSSTLRGG